jgi:hypothetical protein
MGFIQLNCEKFSIRGGEGILFGFEKNFKSRQSTVSVGIGFMMSLGVGVGPVKVKAHAEATESAFITFDGNNGIADIGLENEVKLIGKAPGIGKNQVSFGSKFGINSSYDFNEGTFKGKIK